MIIIHGEDSVSSYKKLNQLIQGFKTAGKEVLVSDAQTLDITTLRQMSSESLFGGDKVLVIKNLLSNQKSKSKDVLVKALGELTGIEVLLYEPKKLTETTLKQFPKASVDSSNISPVIFKYMDMLKPGNSRNLFSGWKRLVELNHEPEYVFAMIVRQVRLLIQAKSGPSYLKLAPYPKKMILSQAAGFDLSHLIDLHESLFEIDKKIKTGSSPLPLEQLISQFFLNF